MSYLWLSVCADAFEIKCARLLGSLPPPLRPKAVFTAGFVGPLQTHLGGTNLQHKTPISAGPCALAWLDAGGSNLSPLFLFFSCILFFFAVLFHRFCFTDLAQMRILAFLY